MKIITNKQRVLLKQAKEKFNKFSKILKCTESDWFGKPIIECSNKELEEFLYPNKIIKVSGKEDVPTINGNIDWDKIKENFYKGIY